MAKRRPSYDSLLLEIAAAIGAGRISIGRIEGGDDEHVHGLTWADGGVVINPQVEIVDTLLHEMTHRLRPAWSERTVRMRTKRLMNQLSHKDVDTLYTLLMTQVAMKRKRRKA
jgi:hypothetical protein